MQVQVEPEEIQLVSINAYDLIEIKNIELLSNYESSESSDSLYDTMPSLISRGHSSCSDSASSLTCVEDDLHNYDAEYNAINNHLVILNGNNAEMACTNAT